jgi:dihydropteroate synthase
MRLKYLAARYDEPIATLALHMNASPTVAPYHLQLNGKLLPLVEPLVMGIVNCTPDSFYDGGQFFDSKSAVHHGLKLIDAGADVVDIGGQSTRPGAANIPVSQEWERIQPAIEGILERNPNAWISIDTFHAEVARRALVAGAKMINDVTAGTHDPEMFPTVASFEVPMAIMHIQGTPETMQLAPAYDSVVVDVYQWLEKRCLEAKKAGISDIIIDVGFGFGKTLEHNYALLDQLALFHQLGHPILVGVSRKSMIWKPLEGTPETALNGATAIHAWALDRGAHFLRVHDVAEAKEAVALHRLLRAKRPLPGPPIS